jgi:hypothetical protein
MPLMQRGPKAVPPRPTLHGIFNFLERLSPPRNDSADRPLRKVDKGLLFVRAFRPKRSWCIARANVARAQKGEPQNNSDKTSQNASQTKRKVD